MTGERHFAAIGRRHAHAIEKRKARMKNMLLQGKGGDDYELIEAIKKMGII